MQHANILSATDRCIQYFTSEARAINCCIVNYSTGILLSSQ
jgi:hypothetical protein